MMSMAVESPATFSGPTRPQGVGTADQQRESGGPPGRTHGVAASRGRSPKGEGLPARTGLTAHSRAGRPLGAHMSIAGGVPNAVARAEAVNATALQIFTRNQLQWRVPELDGEQVQRFLQAASDSALEFVCAHGNYLTNLAATDRLIRERSFESLVIELGRAEALGCRCVVMHPGSPKGDGASRGTRRVAAHLRRALEATADLRVSIAVENTAGQGATLGATFAELGEVIDRAGGHRRLAVCIDTCHAFAAGYDLRTPQDVTALADEIEATVGLDRIMLLHLNDSKGECGQRTDRHEHIGKGSIGCRGFQCVLNEPALRGIPGIIETPKHPKTLAEDRENLRELRRLEAQA